MLLAIILSSFEKGMCFANFAIALHCSRLKEFLSATFAKERRAGKAKAAPEPEAAALLKTNNYPP
jgi:hypothetical protein